MTQNDVANTMTIELVARDTGHSIELCGSSNSLVAFADSLTNLEKLKSICFHLRGNKEKNNQPQLKQIQLEYRNRSRVKSSVYNETLVIIGSQQFLNMMADNIRFLAKNVDKSPSITNNMKIEFYPGHIYLDSGSAPVQITCRPLEAAA